MNKFGDKLHSAVLSEDGSFTAFSKEYNEHYHSTKDGALNETFYKHIYPAFSKMQHKKEVVILDICFGLGFNTLATLLFYKQNNLTCKLKIYSPELDEPLVRSLVDFNYPDEFQEFRQIVNSLSKDGFYKDENFEIEVFLGDAREYVKKFENFFDIVYQDAFSPSVNPVLWTLEYFRDISKAIKEDGVLTTYSISFATRVALWENGFNIYLNKGKNFRSSTVASLSKLKVFDEVDMPHKIKCNPDKKPLMDALLNG